MSVLIMKMLSPLVTEPTFNHSRAVHYNCPAGNYNFKVNNRNTRTRCEICSKLNDVFIVYFEHISHLALVLLLLTMSR